MYQLKTLVLFLFLIAINQQDVYSQQDFQTSIEASILNRTPWSLTFVSSGCFHNIEERLFLSYHNDDIFLHRIKDGKKHSKKMLSVQQIDALIEFETQLIQRPSNYGGCTTVETYMVNSEFNNYNIKDSSCAWNGYNTLVKNIK
ncbi:hypothetical protein [Winogradskyella vincentii]|uniref:Uncharacterized protein n=1 Tax=Winogradskyella vincentii TaxID=2877122 RepID=A0ABS7Y703_9FLAO|nr:hypothetical protein [Winogradskyella vincentii]MCA0154438.1 hypothetical protein [Winogradskyella vincentii]